MGYSTVSIVATPPDSLTYHHPYTMTGSKARVVILWSHPRSCSTMFEMAFLQREEFRTLHEPFGEPFYYGPERMSNRFTPEGRPEDFKKYGDLTFDKMWKDVTQVNGDGKFRTFVKDMAQYIVPPETSAKTTAALPSSQPSSCCTLISTTPSWSGHQRRPSRATTSSACRPSRKSLASSSSSRKRLESASQRCSTIGSSRRARSLSSSMRQTFSPTQFQP